MTSYNVASFHFRFINCPSCNQEYHYTTDGSGLLFDDTDFTLWSSNIPSPTETSEESRYIPVASIYRCKHCKSIIWTEEDVNTYCKRMENRDEAWATLKSASRPDRLNRDELLDLAEDAQLSEAQQVKALQNFLEYCYLEYESFSTDQSETSWPPTPAFSKLEKLLPHLASSNVTDQLRKAELLRNLGRFTEARSLLKQVNHRKYKRIAHYMIEICEKKITHPVVIPPRFQIVDYFKRWVNSKWPGTLRKTKRLTLEDHLSRE